MKKIAVTVAIIILALVLCAVGFQMYVERFVKFSTEAPTVIPQPITVTSQTVVFDVKDCRSRAEDYMRNKRSANKDPAFYFGNLKSHVNTVNNHCYVSYEQGGKLWHAVVVDLDTQQEILKCLVGGDFGDSYPLRKPEIEKCKIEVERLMGE